MVNYANSKVYKIWSTRGDKIYVGSTTKQYLSQRMDAHRSCYKRWKDGSYPFITSFTLFDQYGLDHCFIELLEAKLCSSRDELKQIEGKFIRSLTCVNKKVEGRTRKEHYQDNKEQISEKQKQYREDNKETIIERNKQYYDNHIEQLIEYQSQYRKNNKEKVAERQNKICSCECSKSYNYSNKARHMKSKKHRQYIESQNTKPEDDEE